MDSIFLVRASAPTIAQCRSIQFSRLRLWVAALLSLCVASFSSAQTSSSTLTLEAALDAAQARSGTLQAQDATTRAVQDMATSAGRLPDPVLRLTLNNLPIEGAERYSLTSERMTMRSLEIMQTFTGQDKRRARSLRFEREAQTSAFLRAMQQARLNTQVARAWLNLYYQERTLDLLKLQREEASGVVVATESAYRSGRNSQAEVLAAHAFIARIDDRLHETNAELSNARARLHRWIGDVASNALGHLPEFSRSRLADRQMSTEIDLHPDIAVMDSREHIALAEADLSVQDKNADWSWSLMYSKRASQFGDMVSIGVSFPLQWDQARKQDRELAARLQRVEQVRAEREEMRRERLFEVQRLLASWRSNLTRLGEYDKTIIPLATERVQATQAAFSGGKATLASVLDAQRMVVDTRLERLRIEKQTADWWADLEFLIPQGPVLQTTKPIASTSPAQEQ